ncbi:hypothetical protein CEXT_142461 [Caerostris extrusa]|uniref:Uncharacterized protein n=1 Tax=Caerostris extrusa TaxID=172846 RepID=A0AAV4ULC1_CAEEX|nr:hypothetical protein CEXT_142461 [Caerostris extrusa]
MGCGRRCIMNKSRAVWAASKFVVDFALKTVQEASTSWKVCPQESVPGSVLGAHDACDTDIVSIAQLLPCG